MGEVDGDGIESRPIEPGGVCGISGEELAEPDDEDEDEMDMERARPLAFGIAIGVVCWLKRLLSFLSAMKKGMEAMNSVKMNPVPLYMSWSRCIPRDFPLLPPVSSSIPSYPQQGFNSLSE